MVDDKNFDNTPKNSPGQKQRKVGIPTEALDNMEDLDLEVVLNMSETELSMGRNFKMCFCYHKNHLALLPEVAKGAEHL